MLKFALALFFLLPLNSRAGDLIPSYDFPPLTAQPALRTALYKNSCIEALSGAVPQELSEEQVLDILRIDGISVSEDEITDQARRAVNYLLNQYLLGPKKPSQLGLALLWEQFAQAIAAHSGEFKWRTSRLFGREKEVVYVGSTGFALVITTDAKMYKGILSLNKLSGGRFNSDYEYLTKISYTSRIWNALKRL